MGARCALTALLVLTVITVVRGQTQYYDIIQGLQQLFQPYQGNDFNINQFNNGATRAPTHKQTNRQENKKKIVEQRHQNEERRTKKPPPTNQYDYVFATTQKPSRKTTKSNTSQNNSRSFNNKNEYSNILFGEYYNPYEITTKAHRNRPKTTTTTETSYYFDANRATTQNVFGNNFNVARPVTENVLENVNNRDFAVNQQPRPTNLVNNGAGIDFNNNVAGNANNRPQNDRNRGNNNNQGTLNTDSTFHYPSESANDRNNNGFQITDNNPGFNFGSNTGGNGFNRPTNVDRPSNVGNGGVDFNRGTANFNSNDRVTINNNRGTSNNNNNRGTLNNNNRGTLNNNNGGSSNFNTNTNRPATNNNWGNQGNSNNFNQGGIYFPDNPIVNRPGVVPAPVNINQPPITNRPVTTNNNFNFNRPSEPSSVTFTDQRHREPEILIGPDEDDMSEWQKRRYEDQAESMCDYYKSLTVKKVVALPLLPSTDGAAFNVSDCTPINVPLIIGGTVANIRDFPHMAIVGWRKVQQSGYSWKCGGSLISDRYVLTAGHCTYQDKDANVVSGPPQAVQLGSSFLDDPGALLVRISAVIRHPKYKQRRSYHDVALIQMVSKVK